MLLNVKIAVSPLTEFCTFAVIRCCDCVNLSQYNDSDKLCKTNCSLLELLSAVLKISGLSLSKILVVVYSSLSAERDLIIFQIFLLNCQDFTSGHVTPGISPQNTPTVCEKNCVGYWLTAVL